jgi:hypothetical protein
MLRLGPLLAEERACLEVIGPRRPAFLRHPAITIGDGEKWVDFFGRRAVRLVRRI